MNALPDKLKDIPLNCKEKILSFAALIDVEVGFRTFDEIQILVSKKLDELDIIDRNVIVLSYGLYDGVSYDHTVIASCYRLNPERISRNIAKYIQELQLLNG
jgi:hypothetical protein